MISNGIDIVNIHRFQELVKKENFMNSIFTTQELDYIEKRNFNLATIAGLFCAKEAFLKSIKKGIQNYTLKEIEVLHDDNNAPFLTLHNQIKKDFPIENLSLSISHDGDYAIAIVSFIHNQL